MDPFPQTIDRPDVFMAKYHRMGPRRIMMIMNIGGANGRHVHLDQHGAGLQLWYGKLLDLQGFVRADEYRRFAGSHLQSSVD